MPIGINGTGSITGISAGGLPDATITQAELASGVAGTGPAFRAFRTATTSIPSGVTTKLALNGETFDTANCFDSTTNYRFTPNVAGYYQVNGNIGVGPSGGSLTQVYSAIYKNGSLYSIGNTIGFSPASSIGWYASINDFVYFNGSTDYIELYGYAFGTGTLSYAGDPNGGATYFSAFLARAA